jgi:hypothetical protein
MLIQLGRFLSFLYKQNWTLIFCFTVSIILTFAQNFKQLHFFINWFKLTRRTRMAYFFVKQLTFFRQENDIFWKKCRAVKIWADEFWAVDPLSCFQSKLLQWKPLNMITDNVIIQFMWSHWPGPNPFQYISTWNKSVNVIKLWLLWSVC